MLLLVLLAGLFSVTVQQCLTPADELRKVNDSVHQTLLQSEMQFSIDLLHNVVAQQPESNVLFSPSSVFQTSLLAYFISANHTLQSVSKALHLENQNKLDIFGAYSLENLYQKLRSVRSRSYQLSSANRFYVAKDLKIQNCMKILFAEEIYQANFLENSKGVVKKINQWVASQTRNVIKDFLSEDSITEKTQLFLVNAAYFKGKWKSPFNEEDSYEGMFTLNNGHQVPATFMTQETRFRHRPDKKLGAEVVEIPYAGGDISMIVLLPTKPSATAVPDMLKKLDSKTLQHLVQTLTSKGSRGPKLSVTIPKFTLETSLQLDSILEAMGVDVFKDSADLSILAPGITFSEAVHKAKIKVDEKGTEAAAATSFISARVYTESFIANRPFAYMIYDKVSNIVLFFGIFSSP